MAAKIRLWIVLTAIGVTCVGATAIYGTRIARNVVPELFIARAVLPIVIELTPSSQFFDAMDFAGELLGGSWQQNLVLGINQLESDGLEIDPSAQAILPLLTLHSNMIWDSTRQAYSADFDLRMAVTSVLGADIYLSHNLMAIETPILFDFPIMLDPQNISGEWNESLLGRTILPMTFDDFAFYQSYMSLLFSGPITTPNFMPLFASLQGIENDVDFSYLGREEFDNFSVSIPASRVNTSIQLLWKELESFNIGTPPTFTEDLIILLQIDGSRLVQVDIPIDNSDVLQLYFSEGGGHIQFSTSEVEGDWFFDNNGKFVHSISAPDFRVLISWDFAEHLIAENFSFHMRVEDLSFTASGFLHVSPGRIEANLRQADLLTEDVDASLSLRTTIEKPTMPVAFDSSNARRLADLNIFDLLAMYQNISDSPLGGVLGDFLLLP